MEIINGNKITNYIYDNDYEQIMAGTIEEATIKFEEWINNNTPYRGLGMYAKHKGYNLIFEDDKGNRYMRDGMSTYTIDKYKNLIKKV